ncbi:MAG: hypothetical protein A2046_16365 [Bacteroidetes bacterium GWA2_30_7]|nr:MAG: hypothetical protein A2046_16365 [Bacteroidetes bacterium GWA2_30_7]
MNHFLTTSASLVLFLNKNSGIKSSSSWIFWRETVLAIYEKQELSGTINAKINSGKIISKKIKEFEDVQNIIKNISDENKQEVISLLELYKVIYENSANYIPETFNYKLFDDIIGLISTNIDVRNTARSNAESWFKLKKENRFRTEVYVPASIKPVLYDFALRCIILWAFQKGILRILNNEADIIIYFIIQVVLIPVVIFTYAIYTDKKVIAKTHSLISKINIKNIRIKIKNAAWHYLLIFLLLISGSTIVLLVKTLNVDEVGVVLMAIIYGIYLLILQTNFSKQVPLYKNIKQQIEDREHRELSGELNPEQNDEEIINLEVNLKSENDRMNTYVIEAALFGALAFSGYLTLVSAGNFTIDFMTQFNFHLFKIISYYIDYSGENIAESFKYIFDKNGILVLLSYQTLFCAAFFLSVIASRLRFSKLTDYIDRFLQLSKAMNDKEESLLQNDKTNTEAINNYNVKIKNLLREGYKKQDEILPIMEYMQFFRTLGIVMFFVILITGGLFISPLVSLVISFISMLSMFYFQFGKLKFFFKSLYISMQEFYYRADVIIHWVCWTMIVIALIMRTFAIQGGGIIMVLGFFFLFLHYLMNLFIPPQFDYEIKNSDDAFGSAITFHKILAYIFKISLAIFFLGYMFKAQHWPGANVMVIISILMMTTYFLLVKKIKTGKSWVEYFLGISIATCFMTMLFKFQHWPGAGFFLYLAIPLILISGVITVLKRKLIRPLIIKTVVILCILCICGFSKYLNSAVWNLSLNYASFEQKEKMRKFQSVYYSYDDRLISTNDIGVDSLTNLLNYFNKEFVLVNEPDCQTLNSFAWEAYILSDDSIILKNALLWSETTLKYEKNWEWLDTYASLLYKNKMYEKAKLNAEEAYRLGNDSETKLLLNKIDSVLARNQELKIDSLK